MVFESNINNITIRVEILVAFSGSQRCLKCSLDKSLLSLGLSVSLALSSLCLIPVPIPDVSQLLKCLQFNRLTNQLIEWLNNRATKCSLRPRAMSNEQWACHNVTLLISAPLCCGSARQSLASQANCPYPSHTGIIPVPYHTRPDPSLISDHWSATNVIWETSRLSVSSRFSQTSVGFLSSRRDSNTSLASWWWLRDGWAGLNSAERGQKKMLIGTWASSLLATWLN